MDLGTIQNQFGNFEKVEPDMVRASEIFERDPHGENILRFLDKFYFKHGRLEEAADF